MKEYAKAIVAALVAGLGSLAAVMQDGLTGYEIVTAVIAFLVALGAVWAVPNKPQEAKP